MKSFYLTTTLPYINADPHLGFALELVQADVRIRYETLLGKDVYFNTGTDEHGLKILRKAEELEISPQEYCDRLAPKFQNLGVALNISSFHFIRTTNEKHMQAAQNFWQRCFDNNDIYKKNYEVKYCVGCELEKSDSELEDGHCLLHPNLSIELIQEENYFFRFSKYQTELLALYDSNAEFILPSHRLSEIRNFVEGGLQDFSISRLKEKLPWGVPVPNDPDHVMYVWFDALINYISSLGWPDNLDKFDKYWPGVQIAGKDNLRQQAAMWQAMLMSAKLPPSKQVVIHGFITVDGKKMSKSLGNVLDPIELLEKYGTDPLRYYLIREIPTLDDGDFSHDRMKNLYASELANELGNLLSRLTTLAAKDTIRIENTHTSAQAFEDLGIGALIEQAKLNDAITVIRDQVQDLNKTMNDFAPWTKEPSDRKEFLESSLKKLYTIGLVLEPFMPQAAVKIQNSCNGSIIKSEPLFPRI